jgi:L-iditol 2-dehydrogenase
MRVIIHDKPGTVRLENRPTPTVGSEELLVKNRAFVSSTSDIRAFVTGAFPRLMTSQAGEIMEVGEKVENFEVGEHVFFRLNTSCRKCPACLRGYNNVCENPHFYTDLELAEYIRLPRTLIEAGEVFKVPKKVAFEDAPRAGELSTCINTLGRLNVQAGENVVIVGSGCMGLLHLQLLKTCPVNRIIVSEVNAYRSKKAEEFGADYVINPEVTDISRIKEITNGGADAVIVATANPKAMNQSLEMVRPRGRIGFFGGTRMVSFDTSVQVDTVLMHYKELTVMGIYNSLPDQMVRAIDLIASNRVPVAGLTTHRFNLEQISEFLKFTDDSIGLSASILID